MLEAEHSVGVLHVMLLNVCLCLALHWVSKCPPD